MTIGIFNPYLDTLSGGERYLLTLASCLQKEHDVHVLWHDQSILKKAQEKLSIDLSHVHIRPSPFTRGVPMISSFLKTHAYDVLIVLSDGSIPRVFSKKGVIHFQQPFLPEMVGNHAKKLGRSRFKHVIVNSQFTKRYIDNTFSVRSTVLYPPVPVRSVTIKDKEHIILSVGRFHPVKKHQIMIDAFSAFYKTHPDWQLILVGGLLSQDDSYFKKLSSTSPASVRLMPNASREELVDLYAKATIYWHAAGYGEDPQKHPENFEHFGIAPVEAMASGCMPIVFDGGGLPEIVDESVGYRWKTLDELVSHTFTVLSRDTTDMIKQAKLKSHQYSENAFCTAVHKLIKSL